MTKRELLTRISVIQRELASLAAMVLAMDDEPQPLPVQIQPQDSNDWMTAKQTCERLNISSSTFYEYIKQGLLPPGLAFGPKSKRWKMSEILAWKNSPRKEK